MATHPPPYTPLPQDDLPPAYTAEGPGSTPLQPVVDHSTSTTVEFTQAAPPLNIRLQPQANDNILMTAVVMALCGIFLNIFAFTCLIPALFFAMKAAEANSQGDYLEARKNSQYSLWLNLAAIVSFLVALVLGILIGVVIATSPA